MQLGIMKQMLLNMHICRGTWLGITDGDMHEDETPNAPIYERNMDLWNNEIGREIAYEMKRNLGDAADILGTEWASEIASQRIWEKMQQGELITNPFTDRRHTYYAGKN